MNVQRKSENPVSNDPLLNSVRPRLGPSVPDNGERSLQVGHSRPADHDGPRISR